MGNKPFFKLARVTGILLTGLMISFYLTFNGSVQPAFGEDLDISNQVRVNIGRPYYDFGANQTYTAITLTNISDQRIAEPVKLVITGISAAAVVVGNADGTTTDGLPYLDYSAALGDVALDPDETSSPLTLRFDNPSRLRFTFTTQVWTDQAVLNQPPVADAGPDQHHTILPGRTIDVTLDAGGSLDPDSDAIETYAWSGTPDPADVAQPTVSLAAGTHEFSLTVTDARGAESAPDTVTITVTELSPPQISVDPTDYSVDEGASIEVSVSATDADDQVITLTAAMLPENATFTSSPAVNANGLFNFSPNFDQAGVYTVTITATDPDGLTDSVDLTITVLNVNRPPQVDDQQISARGDGTTPITLTGSDPDQDTLTFSIVTQPVHGTIGGTPPELTYTPVSGYLGDDSFEFQAADSTGAMDTGTVSISVAANRPPQITSMPWTQAVVGVEYNYPVTATDPDGDTLTFSLAAAPDGMDVDADGRIHWTPASEQPTDVAVAVKAEDGFGGLDTQTYWIRVTMAGSPTANTAPVAHAGDDYTVKEGADDVLDGTHSYDAEGDHLRYHWTQTGGPAVDLDNAYAATPAFTAPQVDANTLLTFSLTVFDGAEESPADEVNVMVLNMTLPPEGHGIVTNSNLDGPGSLKAALEYANDHPGTHITFNIPDTDPGYEQHTSGVWTLPSPTMTGKYYWFGGGPVIEGAGTFLDGLSQAENQGDRNPNGPEIEIDYSTSYRELHIYASDVVVQGLVFNRRGYYGYGHISVMNGANIVLIGNYIGTDAAGSQAVLPSINSGILVHGHDFYGDGPADFPYTFNTCSYEIRNLRIGGARPGEGNLIVSQVHAIGINTGNVVEDTQCYTETQVSIQGNYIGTDRTGTVNLLEQAAYPDHSGYQAGERGICITGPNEADFVRDVTIGGVTSGSRNLIVGFEHNIDINRGAGRIDILGNYIGTDISGSVDLNHGRSTHGIYIQESYVRTLPVPVPPTPENTIFIGSPVPGGGNVIADSGKGIEQYAMGRRTMPLVIRGNFIGTDAAGVNAIGSSEYGIYINNEWYTYAAPVIGGSQPGEGNLVGGNSVAGVFLDGFSYLRGNRIGVGGDGVTPVPNGDGVLLSGFAGNSRVGGFLAGEGNEIAHNTGHGVNIQGSDTIQYGFKPTFARIAGNQIYDNGGLGIRKEYDWVGGLTSQPYPVINGAEATGGATRVWGHLPGVKPENCLIELFANIQTDPSGNGEGRRWVGALTPQADGSFETLLSEDVSGLYLTATAIRLTSSDDDPYPATSEFSLARLVGAKASNNQPPQITSTPVTGATAETAYAYPVAATDPEGGSLTYTLPLAPEGMTIDSNGVVSWTPTVAQEGRTTVTVVVRDAQGLLASQNYTVQVLPLVDTQPPVVSAGVPSGGAVEAPTDLIGTIYDPYLVWYGIEIAPQGSGQWRLIHEGNTCVQGGVVGTLDPTLLANGLYDVRFSAYDEGGRLTVLNAATPVDVSGKLKIGQFSLAFQDISLPVVGIPITVTRTYNSFNKERGDFGVGWDLALGSGIKVQVTRTLGTGWYAEETGSFQGSPTYTLRTDNIPKILVTYADGRQDRFEFTPFLGNPLDPTVATPMFTALEGTTTSLIIPGEGDLKIVGGIILDEGDNGVEPLNPSEFQVTTPEGMSFVISKIFGLQRILDRNGNTLTFSPDGVSHSSGLSIVFERDDLGRIETITDPMNNQVDYEYDAAGDLVAFTDPEGNTFRYVYDSNHNLISMRNSADEELLETTFDEQGRMTASRDGRGYTTHIEHDLDAAVEYVTDRNGNKTAYTYDEDGNIVKVTDPEGNKTEYTYDDRGNKLSRRDALGQTTTWTYDERNNRLSETDPLNQTRRWTYNARNQVLTSTDALANKTGYGYDDQGNLIRKTDAMDNETTYAYDGIGNLLRITDCQGHETKYTYDDRGNKLTEIDPLDNLTEYSYDLNGNLLTETRLRTAPSGQVSMVTRYTYDAMNRLIRTEDAEGNTRETEYNDIGKTSAEVDAKGNRTEYEYDESGNRVLTRYPDGTQESQAYDGNGNRISSTDRADRTTTYEYETTSSGEPGDVGQNRLKRIIHPDDSRSIMEYDAAGRMTATIDENGNRTEQRYDDAGRLTVIVDALDNETRFVLDAAGNRVQMVDALNRTTHYEYDQLNRQVRTIYPDGTESTVSYAPGCGTDRKSSETDQAGRTTQFDYDALGRLLMVTDALGGETTYGYDEAGNRISQTDPNDHETRLEYDNLGHMTRRILPMGQSETMHYDPNGNLLEKTDFNGNTIQYGYDSMNRLLSKAFPDGSEVTFTYTATVKRQTATDSRGETAYSYDLRDRLTAVSHPDGSEISYTYDHKGNRTSLTIPSGTTSYAFDALGRLTTVTDPDGGVTSYTYNAVGMQTGMAYPNGTRAYYTYDALNRLVRLENRKSTDEIISSYAYTLDPAGNRVRVVEDTGRTVDYTYDALYRLTGEAITDADLGDKTIIYTYDAFGNRLLKEEDGVTTSYTYNANDQLITETAPGTVLTYTYDANGNTIEKDDGANSVSYTYGFENRLTAVNHGGGITTYQYDVDGIRVASQTGTDATHFIVDINRPYAQVLEERDGPGNLLVSYVYGNDLIRQRRNSGVFYYHYDGHQSTRNLTDSEEVITDTSTYDAFGGVIAQEGETENSYLFSGEQYDKNVDQYYLRARYYDFTIGRFTSHDPLLGDQLYPIQQHRYLFANDNPVMFVDPSGRMSLIDIATTTAVVGTLAAAAAYYFMPHDLYYNTKAAISGKQAQGEAAKLVAEVLNSWDPNSSRYRVFFGRPNGAHEIYAYYTFVEIKNYLALNDIKYYLDTYDNRYDAYIRRDQRKEIFLCKKFFVLPLTGSYITQAGVILHEASHAVGRTNVPASGPHTVDYSFEFYRLLEEVIILARNNPQYAVRNASNYEFYATVGY